MHDDGRPDDAAQAPGTFRRTLLRVMTVQVVSLLLLWLMQSRFE